VCRGKLIKVNVNKRMRKFQKLCCEENKLGQWERMISGRVMMVMWDRVLRETFLRKEQLSRDANAKLGPQMQKQRSTTCEF
jgi:hypothetical protein